MHTIFRVYYIHHADMFRRSEHRFQGARNAKFKKPIITRQATIYSSTYGRQPWPNTLTIILHNNTRNMQP
jgi:hypothetical protein